MRPLRLALKGFTAFRDEQEIDFTELDLFSISGPTGSGKSSILDAMTYALFGKIARIEGVHEETNTSLISQGQPRMAVTFEFRVGAGHYKVTRSTPRTGNTKALLEVREANNWRTHGEGADSVRQVNKLIPDIIGLDYDAFTRSVILPQGKFAEFLVGDATKRRKILTELLGLGLFGEMAARANEIARDAKAAADLSTQLVERDYAGVTKDTLRDARARAKKARTVSEAATALYENVRALSSRAVRLDAQLSSASRCLEVAMETAGNFELYAEQLSEQVGAVANSQLRLDSASIVLDKARSRLEGVHEERVVAQRKWGAREEIVRRRERLSALSIARREANEARGRHDEAAKELSDAKSEVESGAILVRDAATRVKEANRELTAAQKAHHEAHRRDLVGALVSGLEPGAPCPVCDRRLDVIPAGDASDIDRVVTTLKAAEETVLRADADHAKAEAALDAAHRTVETARRNLGREEKSVAARAKVVADLEDEITTAFEGDVPLDPEGELEARLRVLEKLEREINEARAAVEAATVETQQCERAATQARTEVTRIRTAIESAGLRRLFDDVVAAAPDVKLPDVASAWPQEADELVKVTRRAAIDLGKLATEVQKHLDGLSAELDGLVGQARATVPPGLELHGETLEQLQNSAQSEVERTGLEATAVGNDAVQLEEALDRRRALEKEIAVREQEHVLYKALGNELRSDRIVDYLQAEALAALADAGSRQLQTLSGGRYQLCYEDDRFSVVDAWNGEERRSVRTLSGGETFLASLALALALADQVQLLAIGDRQRLESLFLDEGFGTLDAETLEVVVAAIEQLGGEDRLVGVITHVIELAERLPVRIHVDKSPRGSRVSVEDQSRAITM